MTLLDLLNMLDKNTFVQRCYRVEILPSQMIFGLVQILAAESTDSRQVKFRPVNRLFLLN